MSAHTDPLLAMLDAVIREREAASTAGRFVAMDAVDVEGNEAEGLAEFHRRAAAMRANGAVKATDRLVGTVWV